MDVGSDLQHYRLPVFSGTAEELSGVLDIPGGPVIATSCTEIYRGVWKSPDGKRIDVAVKKFKDFPAWGIHRDPQSFRRRLYERFKREVTVWSGIIHPNLHPLLGYRLQPRPQLISPWCREGNLTDYLRGNPGLSRLDKLRLIYQAASGLDHLHSLTPPICHADIKPENVLINDQGEAAVSDFGLSRVLLDLGESSGLTTSETARGTLRYMPGELLTEGKQRPDRKTDVYAFGGLILAVMSGKPPFWGLRELAILLRIVENQTPKSEDHPDLPPEDELWNLIRRCWDADPAARPTMRRVLWELEGLIFREQSGQGLTHHLLPTAGVSGGEYSYMNLDTPTPTGQEGIGKLANWRIDPSSIEFPEDTCELHGGHATVSRALLASTSITGGSSSGFEDPEGGKKMSDNNNSMQTIAVKKLYLKGKDDWERRLRSALREAGLLIELSHKNVIKLKGLVEDRSSRKIWLIFPWEEHGNLKVFVASRDWEIPERVALIYDVMQGVEYLHTRDPPIFHGDLKSVNILVTSKCRAVITDFGSARRITKKDPATQTTLTEKQSQQEFKFQATFCASTSTMTFTGDEYTIRWAAPELLIKNEPYLWSDIWSLGWVCYEVMTDLIPFESVQNDVVVIKHAMDGNLPSVCDDARMSLIIRLRSLMIKCWSFDPTKRPTAKECRKSVKRMPKVIPDANWTSDSGASRARSPELLMKLGMMYYKQSEYTNAAKFFDDALGIYTDAADSAGKSSALRRLADINRLQNQFSEAITLYSEVISISADLGDQERRTDALLGLADVHHKQYKYSKAIALYDEVVQISIYTRRKRMKADALRGLAGVHCHQGDYGRATTLYAEAIEIYTDIGNRSGTASTLKGVAEVHRRGKEYSQAETHFSEALQIYTDLGIKAGEAEVLSQLADIQYVQDHYIDALRLYEQAAKIFKSIGDTSGFAAASRGAALARGLLAPTGDE